MKVRALSTHIFETSAVPPATDLPAHTFTYLVHDLGREDHQMAIIEATWTEGESLR